MSRTAARIVAEVLNTKPNAVLGMATGSTPLGLYQELVRLHQKEQLDFSRVTTFNLDEYVGLPVNRSEERRVGKECRCRRGGDESVMLYSGNTNEGRVSC